MSESKLVQREEGERVSASIRRRKSLLKECQERAKAITSSERWHQWTRNKNKGNLSELASIRVRLGQRGDNIVRENLQLGAIMERRIRNHQRSG